MLDDSYVGYVISEGTLNDYDILLKVEDFLSTLEDPEARDWYLLCKVNEIFKPSDNDNVAWYEEQLSFFMEDLWYYLNSIAPDGCYYGASEGDGACFGFFSMELLEEE